jgi:hypothetical protein
VRRVLTYAFRGETNLAELVEVEVPTDIACEATL